MKTLVIIFSTIVYSSAFSAGLEGRVINIGESVRCEGWPDYEKNKTIKNKRYIYGEVLAEEDMRRISIYGKILNPMDDRDRYTTPFLLLKKMCLYVADIDALKDRELFLKKKKNEAAKKKTEDDDAVKTDNIPSEPIIENDNKTDEDPVVPPVESEKSDSKKVSSLEIVKDYTPQVESVVELPVNSEVVAVKKTDKSLKDFKKLLSPRILLEILVSLGILGLFGLLHSIGFFDKLWVKIKKRKGK